MRSLRDLSSLFPNTGETGLSDDQVSDSRARFGRNALTPLPRAPGWKKFLGKFDDPIIKILLAASLLKIVVDLFEASELAGALALGGVVLALVVAVVVKLGEWLPALLFALAAGLVGVSVGLGEPSYEGLAVMIAVALATGVAFLSEFRSDREFEKLNATRDAIRVKVQRGGTIRTVPLEEVVVGDVVSLEMGDEIPADGRLLKATELRVDQALMTGESVPVKKSVADADEIAATPDTPACVFRGTQVVDGVGLMAVATVGDDTMLGHIARKLSDAPHEESGEQAARVQEKLSVSKASTPLQEKLEVLAQRISTVGYVAAGAIFLALLGQGLLRGEVRLPGPGEDAEKVLLGSVRALLSYFVYMVIIVVVAVPEGLPMSVTVSLAIAWRKMSQANSLVRQLVACETIGSATVICSDKTGTLTQNKMTVSRVGLDRRVFDQAPDGELFAGGAGDALTPHAPP
ncbi:MAG: HAD-IC family P-type ATPase, partial [Gemmataceae bacterium]|nr:HAD-IC family P-type ATPase [Gemmataceae bacterium]